MGIEFDGWQDGMGQLLLAKDQDDIIAHTVGGFGLSAMRQIGKTYFFAGAFFGLSQHLPGLLTIWSAHHSKTHDETFTAMQAFAADRRIAPFVKNVYTGSGDEAVIFHNGSRILFGARERGFGRGVPGVDILMNDEGQILSQRAMQNMLATMNVSEIGIHIYAGTPPKPEDNSETWMNMRDEAWPDPEDKTTTTIDTEDLVWIEIGAEDGCDLDDQEQWYYNPSFPHRTPVQAFKRLRKRLNDEGWRREGLGLYDEAAQSEFDIAKWNRLAALVDIDEPDRAALVLDVSPDRKWACLAIASEYDDDRDLVMVMTFRGTGNIAQTMFDLQQERDLVSTKITPGAAKALETALNKRGTEVDYEILSANEVSAAYGDLQVRIRDSRVIHLDQPELNVALKLARSRMLQTGESESFDRRKPTDDRSQERHVDISPAVAASCALREWGLNNDPMPVIL